LAAARAVLAMVADQPADTIARVARQIADRLGVELDLPTAADDAARAGAVPPPAPTGSPPPTRDVSCARPGWLVDAGK
jgi:hypothetical protein